MSEATELDQACPDAEVQARCQQNIDEEASPKEGTHWIDQILKLFHKRLPPILCRSDVVLVGCRLCLSAFWLSSCIKCDDHSAIHSPNLARRSFLRLASADGPACSRGNQRGVEPVLELSYHLQCSMPEL